MIINHTIEIYYNKHPFSNFSLLNTCTITEKFNLSLEKGSINANNRYISSFYKGGLTDVNNYRKSS